MSSITVNVNQNDKDTFSTVCENLGMNISTAINIFIKAVNRCNGIPFEVTNNKKDFYSESNISHIRKAFENLENGYGKVMKIAESGEAVMETNNERNPTFYNINH
ncbi:MAG: type II toxin-antitoxin system RelB/DinJ family antitoxin [Treponema sp.]|nr:type II toxin-antitoxin system RelB/DinJ family antitoxin [Candidatus Treponema equifaecale]